MNVLSISLCDGGMLLLASFVTKLFLLVPGLAVGGGAFFFVWYRSAFRWRMIENIYQSNDEKLRSTRRFETCILIGSGVAYNSHLGIVTAGVNEDGISLKLIPPFNLFHPSIFLPFSDVSVRKTQWFINKNCFKLTAAQVPKVHIIIAEDLLNWIESNSGVALIAGHDGLVSNKPLPFQTK